MPLLRTTAKAQQWDIHSPRSIQKRSPTHLGSHQATPRNVPKLLPVSVGYWGFLEPRPTACTHMKVRAGQDSQSWTPEHPHVPARHI